MKDKKTAHTEAELAAIFDQNKIDQKYHSQFIAYYNHCFDELYGDMKNFEEDDFDKGDSIQASALGLTREYIDRYLKLLAKGHGQEWAHQMADTPEEGELATYHVYTDMASHTPELAEKELLIHCRSLDGDAYFEKHYLYLFEVCANPDGRIQKSKEYSEIIKQQLSMGRSEVYAHEYADLMAEGEYHEIYCEEYAFAYDEAINQGKSTAYARLYADKYGDAVVDIKGRFGSDSDEEAIDFAIEKVNAFMRAWEYGKANEIKDFNRFAAIYENIHLNVYYADAGWPEGDKEEIDKGILEKALEKFNA